MPSFTRGGTGSVNAASVPADLIRPRPGCDMTDIAQTAQRSEPPMVVPKSDAF